MTKKERTMNELRQVKDSVYNHPNNKDLIIAAFLHDIGHLLVFENEELFEETYSKEEIFAIRHAFSSESGFEVGLSAWL